MPSTALKTDEVIQVANIDKRKLRYWRDLDLVTPFRKATGKGTVTEFNTENLIHLYIIRELSESGLTNKTIQLIMNEVRRCDLNSLPDAVIATNGKDFIEVGTQINFKNVSQISPLFIMRISPLYNKALRDMELFTNQTTYKEKRHGFNRN